jgi:hypothetical protein
MNEHWGYDIQSYWGPRRETPAQIAVRFRRLLDTLAAIDPLFDGWKFFGTTRIWPMPSNPNDEMARLIVEHVARADNGEPEPIFGYRFTASAHTESKTALTINVHAGCYVPNLPTLVNTAGLLTKPLNEETVDLITLPIFKAALLSFATAWDATWCAAYPWDIIPLWTPVTVTRRPTFKMAWITYLSQRFAPMVTPPGSAIVEYTPQGGIVMTATKDRFDVNNPAHLTVAREIEAALAPVNALPWPPDAVPER